MTTNYVINLVNQSSSTEIFWCFLARPDELASDPKVFANSSTSLAVAPNDPGTNTFTIPVQYVVGAGASNQPVGLGIRIDSNIARNSDLSRGWMASYATVEPKMGPTLNQNGASHKDSIAISSNAFDQVKNEAHDWFSHMSFGIQTSQGFIGMSWSPSPQTTRTLTPKLKFYVATGSFGNNQLADWTTVSTSSAEIAVPHDFKYNQTTVTLTANGSWVVSPGKPPGV
jgi:hypothetical protein